MTTTIKTTVSKKDHLVMVDNFDKSPHLRAWGLSSIEDLDEYVSDEGVEEEFEFEYIIRHSEDECPFCILKSFKQKEARD